MRSGNGRHRRPRQAPAIFVTAGVTGAGLALPLLSAGGAHAADTTTWDRVAQCESGGVWSAASGNGFYGGLQLTQEMWDDHGGGAYASRPDLASRAQQIAVAETILDDLGPDAWPSCAVNAGLTKGGRAPQVDPGGVSTSRPDRSDDNGDSQGSSDSSDSSGSWDSGSGGLNDWPSDEPSDAKPSPSSPDDSSDSGDSDSAGSDSAGSDWGGHDSGGSESDGSDSADPGDSSRGPDHTREPTDSATPGDDGDGASRTDDPSRTDNPSHSADPSDGGSRTDTSGTSHEAPAKGKHRGDADDDENGGRAAGGRHASRGDDAHRTGPAADGDYTVRPGDSLSGIADTHRLPGGWHALYERNEGVVGSDADLIQPGQLLDLGHSAD